jgi:cytoplasmic iron level regulating protein YaaA (DUF328/UPF0246 family)
MIIITSPAKKLDFSSDISLEFPKKEPLFYNRSQILLDFLHNLNQQDIARLMKISNDLAILNKNRFENWHSHNASKRQAIFAFNGDLYENLAIKKLDLKIQKKLIDNAENKLFILSGLYGVLRPLDLIIEHRLEMSTNFAEKNFINNLDSQKTTSQAQELRNLYHFWQKDLASFFREKALQSDTKTIINLASNEYSSALNRELITKNNNVKIINIIFQEEKLGKRTSIGINSKKARGSMIKFILVNNIRKIAEIKEFSDLNYQFNKDLSNAHEMFFVKKPS